VRLTQELIDKNAPLALLGKYTPNANPSYFNLEGFIYAKVLVEALKRAGPNPTKAALTVALE
jgi:hypothetical protein